MRLCSVHNTRSFCSEFFMTESFRPIHYVLPPNFQQMPLPEKVAVIYVNAVKFTPTLTHHHQQVMKTMWKGLSATVSDMWEEVHLSGVTMTHAR